MTGCSLGHRDRRRDLAVRGSEKTGDLLGQRLVGGKPGELALPEVEIAPGQLVEIGQMRGVVCFRGHGATITDSSCALGVRSRKARLVALRYRR
jgi:hypothetical protein